jgi:hypothetical protein
MPCVAFGRLNWEQMDIVPGAAFSWAPSANQKPAIGSGGEGRLGESAMKKPKRERGVAAAWNGKRPKAPVHSDLTETWNKKALELASLR